MKLKEVIEKFPSILEMEAHGLEFIDLENSSEYTQEAIDTFTNITVEDVERELREFVNDRNNFEIMLSGENVIFSFQDDMLHITDHYNKQNRIPLELTASLKDYKDLFNQLVYYATDGEYLGDDFEDDCNLSNLKKIVKMVYGGETNE